ncbi:MAG: hypothetical protein IT165_00720 [Bryobacterales bacterium]|nr:hypothetical protein [Bryobacterales bacterium]
MTKRVIYVSMFLLASVALAKEIPAGAAVTVRMIDSVDSRSNSVGQMFRGSLDEPVMLDGKTVLPRGSDVQMKLSEVKQAGKLTGKPELSLTLVSIGHDGKTYTASSSDVTTEGKSKTKKSGAVVGGAAALGAVIGALAGGGKGAAIGALSGAGAGGAYQVLTKGDAVKIPSETRLTFTLAQPIAI